MQWSAQSSVRNSPNRYHAGTEKGMNFSNLHVWHTHASPYLIP